MDTKEVLAALSAMAQESRLGIFRLLVQVGPEGMAATRIAKQLDIMTRMNMFVSLPLQMLEKNAIEREIQAIGATTV
ncbi:hypothetical protein CD932_01920 [Janthinobacterium sp. PC23-8]|nr:hypothetical protein CD932_01920 [Janthinobacterium sp. PC23-8]